jgi:Xaa-Pro aminopeptidase
MVHTDTGAEFNFFSADIQRNVAVDGSLSAEQRRIYEIALRVQKTVIDSVRPGVTWRELQRMAERMLSEAGGYDRYYSYGIGHFIGMDVHDEGDYDVPLQPGMALSIEQGVFPPNGPHAAFEDDVIVTPTGREWVSRSIPIEIAEIEALAREPSGLTGLLARTRRP